MKVILNNLVQFKDQKERTVFQNKSYSKLLSILIHGIKQDEKPVRENNCNTTNRKKLTFMKDGLEMDFDEVPMVDFHRLNQ